MILCNNVWFSLAFYNYSGHEVILQIILKRPEWLGRIIIDSMLKRNYTSQILTDGLKSKINPTFRHKCICLHQGYGEVKKGMLL